MKAKARKPIATKSPKLTRQTAPWIRPGAIAIHKRTGNRYTIDAIALDKTHETKVVVYRPCVGEAMVYVRERNEFAAKFTADKQLSMSLE